MKAELAPGCSTDLPTGMARALLNEVADRLRQLAGKGTESAIDLRSLPLTRADLDELEALLGKGEVTAELSIIGPTSIWETAYSGVWWIRHLGANGQTASEQIAITPLPEILKSHPEDIAVAADRIHRALDPESSTDTL